MIQPKSRFNHRNGFHHQFIEYTVSTCQGPRPVLVGPHQRSPRRLSARYVRPDESDRKVGFAQASVETWGPKSSVSTTHTPDVHPHNDILLIVIDFGTRTLQNGWKRPVACLSFRQIHLWLAKWKQQWTIFVVPSTTMAISTHTTQ